MMLMVAAEGAANMSNCWLWFVFCLNSDMMCFERLMCACGFDYFTGKPSEGLQMSCVD